MYFVCFKISISTLGDIQQKNTVTSKDEVRNNQSVGLWIDSVSLGSQQPGWAEVSGFEERDKNRFLSQLVRTCPLYTKESEFKLA